MLIPIAGIHLSGTKEVLELVRIMLGRKEQIAHMKALPPPLNTGQVNDLSVSMNTLTTASQSLNYAFQTSALPDEEILNAFQAGTIQPIVVVDDLYSLLLKFTNQGAKARAEGGTSFFGQFEKPADAVESICHFANKHQGWIELANNNNLPIINATDIFSRFNDVYDVLSNYLSINHYVYDVIDRYAKLAESSFTDTEIFTLDQLTAVRESLDEKARTRIDRLNKALIAPESD